MVPTVSRAGGRQVESGRGWSFVSESCLTCMVGTCISEAADGVRLDQLPRAGGLSPAPCAWEVGKGHLHS